MTSSSRNENYIVPMDLTEVIAKLGRKGASRFADEVTDFFGDMEKMARSKRYLKAAAPRRKQEISRRVTILGR